MNNLANQNRPATEMEMAFEAARMSLQAVNTMTALFQSSMDKVTQLNKNVNELLNSTQLQDHERYNIQNLISEKVNELIKQNEWTKDDRKFIFQDFYRALKKKFSVPKYGNIKRVNYEDAVTLIEKHTLTGECMERIEESRRSKR